MHVGQDDASPALARRLIGDDAIIGLSTHAPDEVWRAVDEPVDYVSAGPVVETPTKPGRAGTGIEYICARGRRGRTARVRDRAASAPRRSRSSPKQVRATSSSSAT